MADSRTAHGLARLLVLVSALVVGCGDPAERDAGVRLDAGREDAGEPPDGGAAPDAGRDAGPEDAGGADAGCVPQCPVVGPCDDGCGGTCAACEITSECARDADCGSGFCACLEDDCSVRACVATPRCRGYEVTVRCVPGVTCVGTPGDDVILGTPGDDSIDGGLGNDVICGGDGADTIAGGGGWDRIDGGGGDDVLAGDDGVDLLWGGGGDDQLFGGPAADLLEGGQGLDQLAGGPGVDYCFDSAADTVVPWGAPGACEYALRGIETSVYATAAVDGSPVPLRLDVYDCEDADAHCGQPLERDPPVVFAHGGGFHSGSRLDMTVRLFSAQLASMGFRVSNVDYRTVGVGPTNPGTSDPYADLGPWGRAVADDTLADRVVAPRGCASATMEDRRGFTLPVLTAIDDVLTAIDSTRARFALADDTPVFLAGSSAGAISALYAAYGTDELERAIPAAVRRGAPRVRAVFAMWGGFYPTACALNDDREWMQPGDAALYLMHGEADTVVDVSYSRDAEAWARSLAPALPVEAHYVPGAGHGWLATGALDPNHTGQREVVAIRAFVDRLP